MMDGRGKPNATVFKKGEGGRKKGSRNRITKKYLDTLVKAWDPNVIEELKEKRPDVYIKLYSQLVPKDLDIMQTSDVNVTIVRFADLSDDDDE